jgi:hypothetical protein
VNRGTGNNRAVATAAAGHKVTVRLVRDWTQAGLLDRPRPAVAVPDAGLGTLPGCGPAAGHHG